MAAKVKTDHELREEIQALRIQLQEAEETLDAIRHGEIDALVVNGPDGEQVFTLQGADHPYRLMVETMREGAVTVTLDGTIVYCNQSFAELLGNALERLPGSAISLYVANEDASTFAELMEGGKRESSKGEIRLTSATGVLVPVSISTSPLLMDQLPAVCLVVTDLTEHQHNEELRVSEKLAKALHEQSEILLAREQEARSEAEKANRVKDEFLATVSHELRNPLNAILGWSSILRSRETNKEQGEHALEVIERNARVQLKLIEDLLDVSRIESGKLVFSYGELDVVRIIETAVEAAQPAAAAKQIQLNSNAGNACAIVLGDAGRLQQIVGNLLSNAIKFTPAGGTVNVELDIQLGKAVITVADSGEGISPEFLPFVFDRFRQADASTKRPQGGLGLGLAVVRHLVELHGGNVTAESLGIGRGATFIVRLPLSTVQDAMTDAAAKDNEELTAAGSEYKSPLLDGVKVLVLDDDSDAREFLQILLSKNGAQVKGVATASEAYMEVQGNVPDILICDIGLPDEDGYEFIRRIRSLTKSSSANVPALALTAYALPNDRKKALIAGYHDHLTKPVEPHELLNSVASIARRKLPVALNGI
jgi:PAS domain S-box-containing protein